MFAFGRIGVGTTVYSYLGIIWHVLLGGQLNRQDTWLTGAMDGTTWDWEAQRASDHYLFLSS